MEIAEKVLCVGWRKESEKSFSSFIFTFLSLRFRSYRLSHSAPLSSGIHSVLLVIKFAVIQVKSTAIFVLIEFPVVVFRRLYSLYLAVCNHDIIWLSLPGNSDSFSVVMCGEFSFIDFKQFNSVVSFYCRRKFTGSGSIIETLDSFVSYATDWGSFVHVKS